jgi:hypothetical protein
MGAGPSEQPAGYPPTGLLEKVMLDLSEDFLTW